MIKQVNLDHIAKRPLGLASGGEKQKAYLAQALINDPDLLILDESTASLDPNTKRGTVGCRPSTKQGAWVDRDLCFS